MPKVTMKTIGGAEIVLESNSDKDLFRQMSFWGGLPTHCPIDDTPTRLEVRTVDKLTFYSAVSTGEGWRSECGQNENGETLYNKLDAGWKRWNKETKEEEIRYAPAQGRAAVAAPKATAGKPAPVTSSLNEIPSMSKEEVDELKDDLRAKGLKTKGEADRLLKKLNREPGDWSNFQYDEAATIIGLVNDLYAQEPATPLF